MICILVERLCSPNDETPSLPQPIEAASDCTLTALLVAGPVSRRARPSTQSRCQAAHKRKSQKLQPAETSSTALSPKAAAKAPTGTCWQQSISILLKHKVPRKLFSPALHNTWGGLGLNWILPLPSHSRLHFLLPSSGQKIVCSDCYQPPVSGWTVISCLCLSRRVTPSFLSKSLHGCQQGRLCWDFLGFGLGGCAKSFFHKITSQANCLSHQKINSGFWNVLTSRR